MTESFAAMLPDVAIKSGIVILVAWVIVTAMSRRSAAERHMVWVLALAAVLAIPLLGTFVPRFTVPGAGPSAIVSATRVLQSMPIIQATTFSGANESPTVAEAAARPSGAAASAVPAATEESRAQRPDVSAAAVLLGLWLIGAAVVLLRYAVLRSRVHRKLRALPRLTDPALATRIESLCREFGIRSRVVMLSSARDRSPWTWGWRRPRLILPDGFSRWSSAAQRQVLMHELAHIRRNDHLIGALAQLCCAAYWFNPLVWLAARGIRLESEKACDDRVLAGGESATAYADQLLQIANRVFRERSRSVWIQAMAHRSSLAPRVHSILDSNNRRHAMSKLKSSVFAAAALALAVSLAGLRATQSIAQEASPALGETEFLQLVQRGPDGSDELEIIVDTWVADGRDDDAADALARFMMHEYGTPDGDVCEYCIQILSSEGTPRQHEHFSVMVAALDLVEQRAEQDNSGDVLLDVVLANAGGSGNRNAMSRAAYYVMRAIQIGIDESNSLRVAQFLYQQGNAAEALDLVRRLYGSESSVHYQSPEAQQWVVFLEREVQRSSTLTRMIIDSLGGGPATVDGEYLPITKTPPVYPSAAAEQRLEGHVVLEFTVDTDGKPVGITVVESSDSIFNESAIAAAARFRYAPRLVAGTPVAVPGVRNRIVYALE